MGNYWQKRFQAVEAMNNKTAKETVQAVTPAFDKAQAQIEKEINAWYARFAKNNQISLLEAKKLLNSKELKEFKWDVHEYIKYGRQNALDQKWMKELENASARFHISRLEALKVRTQNAVEKAFGNEVDALDEMAARIYMDDYYHTAYEIQRGLGIGFDVSQIDERKLNAVLSKPWTADKMTFSDRIWKSKTQLIDSLHTELTQMCVLGKAPDQTISNIAKRMNVSKGQAGRLIMTESAYFGSAAQKDCFNDLDVEKFEVVATLDNRTSDVCQSMDGKVFDMKDFEVGVTAPPFHVWCRSCTAPWFPDDDGMRAARDATTGKTYYVPSNMTYPDWKEYFVDKTKDPADLLKSVTGVRFLWNDDFSAEAQKSYTDTYNKLSEMYPMENVKIEVVGDTFEIRGFDRNLPDDKIREDVIYDELGQMFGAQYMPEGMNVLPSKGAFIEIADNERSVISLDDWFKQMREHRSKNGTPKTLEQCFNNAAEGTEAVITHEYAHALADNYGFYGSSESGKWLRDIFDKYDDLEIAKQISRYATTSPDEFFAECFVKSFDKYSESKIATEVMGEFRHRYGIGNGVKEKIQNLKDIISATGEVTEDVLQEAGKLFQEELLKDKQYSERIQKIDDLEVKKNSAYEEYKKLKKEFDEMGKELPFSASSIADDLIRYRKGLIANPESEWYKDGLKRLEERAKNIDPKYFELHKKQLEAYERYRSVNKMLNEVKNTFEFDNAEDIKRILSQIREMGSDGIDIKKHLNNSRSPVRKYVEQAYSYYPKDWVKASVKHGNLKPMKVDHGYYSHWRGEIAISGYGDISSFQTSLHELGHRMERIVPEIKKAEKVFYDRRTAGESLEWLGSGYAKSETTRKDNFLHPYMGKDYAETAYELVSMGFEYGYTNPKYLMEDSDMANWIYGILSLL